MSMHDTKGHLVQRVIPKLAQATPGFPYFPLDAIKAELGKHEGGVKPESLNHYMHELTTKANTPPRTNGQRRLRIGIVSGIQA